MDYYKRDEHGPFDEVPLDRRYCTLKGGYVLCPALDPNLERCTRFDEPVVRSKNDLFGIFGQRTPLDVPVRCKACRDSHLVVSLKLGKKKVKSG